MEHLITVKNKFGKNGVILILLLLAVIFIFTQNGKANFKSQGIPLFIFQIVVYIFSILILFDIVRSLFGHMSYKVVNQYLTIEKKCFITYYKRQYKVEMISNMNLIKEHPANTYVGFQGLRFYLNDTVLSFLYGERKVNITIDISDRDFAELKRIVR